MVLNCQISTWYLEPVVLDISMTTSPSSYYYDKPLNPCQTPLLPSPPPAPSDSWLLTGAGAPPEPATVYRPVFQHNSQSKLGPSSHKNWTEYNFTCFCDDYDPNNFVMKRPNSVSVSTDEAREVYEAQRDEICNLTLPPARELRDFHKELWIKYVAM